MWRDKDKRKPRDDWSAVPKQFYKNYKVNMIRDANVSSNQLIGQQNQTQNRFKSYNGAANGRVKSKHVFKNAYNLHKPYNPCRRTCAVNHNPKHAAERINAEHLERLHGSATRLMIMRVVPDRPFSADSATKAFEAYIKDIDFFGSGLHVEAQEHKL